MNGDVTVDGKLTVNKYGIENVLDENPAFATIADTEVVINGNYEVETYAKTELGGDMRINKDAQAVFKYASYSTIADLIYINGTFNRVLSSGGQTSNAAKVYCGSYQLGADNHIVNGGPQSSPNNQ